MAPRLLILLHALILLDRLGRDSGRGLCAIAYLRVGRGRADRAPCLATGHADRDATDQ